MWTVIWELLYLLVCFWNYKYAASLFGTILKEKIIFADICISYILVTIFLSILFKTQEHKFKAEDVFLSD
jgi:hypothetical protein